MIMLHTDDQIMFTNLLLFHNIEEEYEKALLMKYRDFQTVYTLSTINIPEESSALQISMQKQWCPH